MPRTAEGLQIQAIRDRVAQRRDAPFRQNDWYERIPPSIKWIGALVREKTQGDPGKKPDGLAVVRAITELTGGDPLDKVPDEIKNLLKDKPL